MTRSEIYLRVEKINCSHKIILISKCFLNYVIDSHGYVYFFSPLK